MIKRIKNLRQLGWFEKRKMYQDINISILLIITSFLLLSCEKEEIPVEAHDQGDIITNSVKMEADYRYQLYFDLETNTMVKQHHKTIWDLGFETSATGNKVVLNTSKLMYAANTQQTNFASVVDTAGLTFKWDASSGNLDSTAIGTWTANNVYVIDRGFDELGAHQGFSKIEFLSVNTTEYTIHFSNLDGTNDKTINITKDTNYNLTFLSLNGNVVSVEPLNENWDLAFTQYTYIFYDETPITPYIVTGCLSNRNKIEVAQVFNKDFADITFADVSNYTFSSDIDVIGYSWKEYDFGASNYIIYYNKNYLIKSTEGKYYKLHFIDFYDSFGVKGTPTFEFQEL